ncbi:MAG: tRNA epoxyqueuosine(34) reductase QueG [Bacteroidetes bacterium GWF2_38_335]|nr:MAG: tRNA epoxyqueuosine(34) reductase QueG [Bacteroidetes bacterium GWF2_38_335]OFY81167.1 MAG: tRNA epoxyqueuosine(34) reductase QueG [Bacteroidetes bacterium RIFOXYA12_FULL_38_20]HBS85279.1 tRNA epoxyqueuosine(34) reductase QueG [Bacteroidales bacterium]
MDSSNVHNDSEKIKKAALDLGFSACGISPAVFLKEDEPRIKSWLENSYHGELHYMENNLEKRLDASKLVENAKSVISVLLSYYSDKKQTDGEAPVLSKYAYGKDYHVVLKDKLYQLAEFINQNIKKTGLRVFVDSGPVLDRSYARQAGLGWVGKNCNLINRNHGSFVFIGELIVDIELEFDRSSNDYCGTCTKCLDACPTGALIEPRVLDVRKCITYLTTSYKGDLPVELKEKFRNRVYGCDICQDVCPWNAKVPCNTESGFQPKQKLLDLTRQEWHEMDKALFDELFEGSVVIEKGFERLRKNITFIQKKD